MCKKYLLIIGMLVFFVTGLYSKENYVNAKLTLSGYVQDKSNGEMLVGVTVYIDEIKGGAVTNLYGYYSISLPQGNYHVSYSFVGYETQKRVVNLNKSEVINMELSSKSELLEEVVITGKNEKENIQSNQMSVVKVQMKEIKKVPALMGEVDVIKVMQLLPGVKTAGEGSSGFSVRGGSMDQNLILLDEATVYNASHLMGFFSVFNNDAIKDVQLYKGDIPAEYGGRLSSLLDIRQKDGNMKSFCGTGGIGSISSRLTLEGPIIKDKTSFIVAGRRSYADVFLKLAPDKNVRNNILYFYDLNMKLNHKINENNRLYISGYLGRDVIGIGMKDPIKVNWGNSTLTLRWNHLFNKKLFSNFSFINSNYGYFIGRDADVSGFKWEAGMKDYSFKSDFGYYLNPKNTLKFGIVGVYHQFQPGITSGTGSNSIINEFKIPSSNALEYSGFITHETEIKPVFSVNYGLRYTIFHNIGSALVYHFDKQYNPLDSSVYSQGQIYNTYHGMEPRISAKYLLNEFSSLKGSYAHTLQLIQLASNSTVGTPLDIWLPASPNIKPQQSDQLAVGYFRNIRKNTLELSVEVYYKNMRNQIDFKDHAVLLMNKKIEGELRFGKAYAYGVEFLLRKQKGKFTGWVGYTYSSVKRVFETINNGEPFSAPYDKPHDISVVMNYQISKRVDISATWVYNTGNPITFPTGRFEYGNLIAPVYSDRNAYRLPDYHRMDLGITINGKEKPNKKYQGSWNISVYNVYNRHNAYSIDFRQNEDNPNITEAYKTYLFPIIPAVTYNFKF